MLDNIKQYISDLPDVDFDDYYQQYILDVQDINLSLEFKYSNISDHLSIEALLAKIHGELNR
jgi:hypothetical protein